MISELVIDTPSWAVPLLDYHRYIGIYGGRGSGKSHFVAELLVEETLIDPNKANVCLREIQKSLQYSAKRLIEHKIRSMGVSNSFNITKYEIKRVGGDGLFIFQGMQDHTADTIKSLEGFDNSWFEEAQTCSDRSLKLLRPTIRKAGSKLIFTWNPETQNDPVDKFFRGKNVHPDSECVQVNWFQNPFLPDVLRDEMEADRSILSDEDYQYIWEGAYNEKSKALVFAGKYKIEEFTPSEGWGAPYHGLDFGFAQDPTTCNRVWVHDDKLFIEYEANKIGLELDDTSHFIKARIPNIERYVIRADSARPESISYLKRKGLPKITGVKKWSGSVVDGVSHLKSYKEIIIHPRCVKTAQEFRLYSYKVDKRTGDILPAIVDANNHHIDGIRYAVDPLITRKSASIGALNIDVL